MASFVKRLLCGFVLVVLFSTLIQARESKFFSKFTHFSTPLTNGDETITSSPIEAPELAPVEAPASASTPTPATVETSAPAPEPAAAVAPGGENEVFDEEFEGGNYEKGYQNSNYNNNGYTTSSYNDKGYTTSNYNNNNYNGYKLAGESESHETANQNNYNSYTSNYNNNNNGYTSNYDNHNVYTSNYDNNNNGYTGNYNSNNGYELASESYETGNQNNKNKYSTINYNNGYDANQRQGMSDTRFMEGGKYYYDMNKESNYYPANGYATGQVSGHNQVNYGNSENRNTKEFNTMQYENQELYDENQEEESLP